MTSATFTNDELILVLIGLVRATHPSMLRQDKDGFSVDFEMLGKKKKLTADERLLLRMRAAMDVPGEPAALVLELEDGEGARLADTFLTPCTCIGLLMVEVSLPGAPSSGTTMSLSRSCGSLMTSCGPRTAPKVTLTRSKTCCQYAIG